MHRVAKWITVISLGLIALVVAIAIFAEPPEDEVTPNSEVAADDGETKSASPTATPTELPGFSDGTFLVGDDITPGTYRSTGTGLCYWARLSGFQGGLSEIIGNGNDSPEIVSISPSDVGFETRGCGRWLPIELTGDGTWRPHSATGLTRWASI